MLKDDAFTVTDSQVRTVVTEKTESSDKDDDFVSFIVKNADSSDELKDDMQNNSASFIQKHKAEFLSEENDMYKKHISTKKEKSKERDELSVKKKQTTVKKIKNENNTDHAVILVSSDTSFSFYEDKLNEYLNFLHIRWQMQRFKILVIH